MKEDRHRGNSRKRVEGAPCAVSTGNLRATNLPENNKLIKLKVSYFEILFQEIYRDFFRDFFRDFSWIFKDL